MVHSIASRAGGDQLYLDCIACGISEVHAYDLQGIQLPIAVFAHQMMSIQYFFFARWALRGPPRNDLARVPQGLKDTEGTRVQHMYIEDGNSGYQYVEVSWGGGICRGWQGY